MVDRDVVLEKVNRIQRCLKRIQETVSGDLDRVNQFDVQDIVTLNLQRAAQLVIDIAGHLVSSEKLGLPQNMKDLFVLLEQQQIISSELALRMTKMVGFRNIAVHDYEQIDSVILRAIVQHHLKDFEDFYTCVLQRYM